MRRALHALLGALALAGAVPAQDMDMSPAKGMASFRPMLGNWEGAGKVWMGPGTEPTEWKAVSSVTEILNGHAVQEDMRIDMGGPMPPLLFRSLYAWDRVADRPVSFGLANMGTGTEVAVRWVDAKTLVGASQHVEDGLPSIERYVARFEGDAYTFHMEIAKGAEPFYTHVEGSFQRSEKGFDARAADSAVRFAPPGAELPALERMRPFGRMTGAYDMKAELTMVPGADPFEVAAREELAWMFGETLLAFFAKGEPMGDFSWEGHGYLWWDPLLAAHVHLHVNNVGQVGTSQVHWLDGRRIAFTGASVHYGAPGADRFVIELDEAGRMARAYADRLHGAEPSARTFDATYSFLSTDAPAARPAYTAGSCCDRAAKAGNTCSHPCCIAAAKDGKLCAACN